MFNYFFLLLVQRHLKGNAYLQSQSHSYFVSLYFIALSFPEDGIIFHTPEPVYVLPEALAQLLFCIFAHQLILGAPSLYMMFLLFNVMALYIFLL